MSQNTQDHVGNPADFMDVSNPTVQKFFSDREALISKEKVLRSDHEFRLSLSPTATKACEIVSQIRLHEQATIWKGTDTCLQELYPGMPFNLGKYTMKDTKLFQIISKMPKGSLLHCHLGAMVDFTWVFNITIDTPRMCILATAPLILGESMERAEVKIEYSKLGAAGPQIWTEYYVPGTHVTLKEAAESFPDGGRDGFVAWMKGRCSITKEHVQSSHLGVNDIWKTLSRGFVAITPVVFYEPITRKFLREFFRTAMADGITWIEMRGMTRSFRLEGQDELTKDRTELVRVIHEEVKKFKASAEGEGFWGVRMIWDCLRTFDDQTILNDMHQCLRAKQLYPALLSGYDLVGTEDHGRPLSSLAPLLLYFQSRCAALSLNIPFFFHAGETIGSGDSTDHNLFDSILFSTRRIGHGFSLYKHPLLIDMVKERGILIESCPVSNEVLRYSSTVSHHPLPALLARGVKCSLSNDDPSMMGQGGAGMTCDFWQAMQSWEDLGLAGLASMAQNSVRFSAFEDQTDSEWFEDISAGVDGTGIRARRIKEWNAEWEAYCAWIVEKFEENIR